MSATITQFDNRIGAVMKVNSNVQNIWSMFKDICSDLDPTYNDNILHIQVTVKR